MSQVQSTPLSRRSTVRRVLALIRPYAGLVALTLTLAVVTVVTTLLAPVISGKAVDLILGPGQVDFAGVARLAVAMAATDRKSTRLNSSHSGQSRMPSSA